jgi:hypothetical protein
MQSRFGFSKNASWTHGLGHNNCRCVCVSVSPIIINMIAPIHQSTVFLTDPDHSLIFYHHFILASSLQVVLCF